MFKKIFVIMLIVMIIKSSLITFAGTKQELKLDGSKLMEVVKGEMRHEDDFVYDLYESQDGDLVRILVDHKEFDVYIHYYFMPDSVTIYIKEAERWDKVVFGDSEINSDWYNDLYNGEITTIGEVRRKLNIH